MESLQSWALSCHKSDSPKALYIFMQPSTFILSIYTSLCSLYISTHIISLYLYALFICCLYVLFIIYLLHLYSLHIYMFSTFYAPLHIYVSLHLCAPLHLTQPLLYMLFTFIWSPDSSLYSTAFTVAIISHFKPVLLWVCCSFYKDFFGVLFLCSMSPGLSFCRIGVQAQNIWLVVWHKLARLDKFLQVDYNQLSILSKRESNVPS